MRELEGRSYDEIATALGVTVPAVEMLIFRARKSLRLQRGALRGIIGIVPLPASLSTFGGGAATAGGAALGLGTVAKVAFMAAALALGGAAGYEVAVKAPRGHREAVVHAVPVADAVKAPSAPAAARRSTRPSRATPKAARPHVTLTRVRVARPAKTGPSRPAAHSAAAAPAAAAPVAVSVVDAAPQAGQEPRAAAPAQAPASAAAATRPVTTTVTTVRDAVRSTVHDAVDDATQVGKTVVGDVASLPGKVTSALPSVPTKVETPPVAGLPAVTVTVPAVVPDPVAAAPLPTPPPPVQPPAQAPVPTVPTTPSLPPLP
jgi:hypothetical protein